MNRRGFTIVELLIVIVVIAILAAITIVAYNGIQNRAKQSAAQSALSQANKKILAYAVQNSDTYPTSLALAGITNADGLQYSYDNDSSPKKYGLTSTNGTFSFYVSNATTNPTAGGYPGHGQGGIPPIENLVRNPKAATVATDWGFGIGTGAAASAATISTGGPVSGASSYRRATWSTGPTTGAVNQTNSNTSANLIEEGKTYTISAYFRPSWATTTRLTAAILDSANATLVSQATTDLTHAAGQWTRRSVTTTAPAGAYRIIIYAYAAAGGNPRPGVGDTLDVTGFQITEGSTLYDYADGDSANWAWSSTPNLSTSKGPPL